MFHAKLRLPRGTAESELVRHVDTLLTKLSLLKCRDSRIGDAFVRGISGGEKRRLSIATELLTKPQVRTALLICVVPSSCACRELSSLLSLLLCCFQDTVWVKRAARASRLKFRCSPAPDALTPLCCVVYCCVTFQDTVWVKRVGEQRC